MFAMIDLACPLDGNLSGGIVHPWPWFPDFKLEALEEILAMQGVRFYGILACLHMRLSNETRYG